MSLNPFQSLIIPLIIKRLREFSDNSPSGGGVSPFGDRIAGAVTEQAAIRNSQLASPALYVIDAGSRFGPDGDSRKSPNVLYETQAIDFVLQVDEPQAGGRPGEAATDALGYRAAMQAQMLAQYLQWALCNADFVIDECTLEPIVFTDRAGVIATGPTAQTGTTGARQFHRISATIRREISLSAAYLNPGGPLWDGMNPFLWTSNHLRDGRDVTDDGSGWCESARDAPDGHFITDVRRSGGDPPPTPC